jgi:hypothetical protein
MKQTAEGEYITLPDYLVDLRRVYISQQPLAGNIYRSRRYLKINKSIQIGKEVRIYLGDISLSK